MNIRFATPMRGFFKHLLKEDSIKANIENSVGQLYEVHSTSKKLINKLLRSTLFDHLGLIHAPKAFGYDCDLVGSFNRFLTTDQPYFIYVENPTGLYHYRLARSKSLIGRLRLKRFMTDSNLKALVCMSQACYNTFEKVCHPVPQTCTLTQIYPLIPNNPLADEDFIQKRCQSDKPVKLLFIAQGNAFISKGVLDILEAYSSLKEKYAAQISLTIVTSFQDADPETLEQVRNNPDIELHDFKFSYEQMQELYASHSLLLVPTSHDSFNLTILEAMKAGLPVIGTRLYAIPEMVQENVNGFLTDPTWWFFDANNIPNPKVWNNRDNTIFVKRTNERMVKFLTDKIELLLNDRELLTEFSLNSYRISNSAPFSKEYIVEQWNKLFDNINSL